MQGHKPLYANDEEATYRVTNLNNGFTVLTESQTFPGAVNMGKYQFEQTFVCVLLLFTVSMSGQEQSMAGKGSSEMLERGALRFFSL